MRLLGVAVLFFILHLLFRRSVFVSSSIAAIRELAICIADADFAEQLRRQCCGTEEKKISKNKSADRLVV